MPAVRSVVAGGRDLFFRGRGADIGTSAPQAVVRLAGAGVAIAILTLAELLGFVSITGIPINILRFTAVVGGALLATTRVGAWLWYALGLHLILLLLVLYTPLVKPMVPGFIRYDQLSEQTRFPVILVLSGGMNDDGRLNDQALDRLLTALRIVQQRQLPHIALSVTSREGGAINTEADQRSLVQLVVPQTTLHFVRDVHSTYDEALAFAALARTNGWTDVAVLTSPLHTARACTTIERQDLRVTCLSAELRDYSLARLDRPENRRKAFMDAVYEAAAWVLYRLRGWA